MKISRIKLQNFFGEHFHKMLMKFRLAVMENDGEELRSDATKSALCLSIRIYPLWKLNWWPDDEGTRLCFKIELEETYETWMEIPTLLPFATKQHQHWMWSSHKPPTLNHTLHFHSTQLTLNLIFHFKDILRISEGARVSALIHDFTAKYGIHYS